MSTRTSVAPATSSPGRRGRRPRTARSEQAKRQRWGLVFVAPFVVVFVAMLVVPLAYAFWLSLQTNTLAFGSRFSGLDNYTKAFTDPAFLSGVWLVVRFSFVLIPLQMLVSLVAALVLDAITTRFAAFARLMIFLPYAIPVVIGALMWGFLYSPQFGPGAQVFGLFGMSSPAFLSPDHIFGSLVNVVTWQWAGYYMIILFAALRGIDPSVYEAAALDGANSLQVALRIKVPMIASSLVVILVFALIGTLQFFTEPQILRAVASGAISSTYTPNIYAYSLAFQYSQFNYASAISFALGLVVFVFSYLFLFLTRRRNGVM